MRYNIIMWGRSIYDHKTEAERRAQLPPVHLLRGGPEKPILKCISTFSGKEEMHYSIGFSQVFPAHLAGGVPAEVELVRGERLHGRRRAAELLERMGFLWPPVIKQNGPSSYENVIECYTL